MSHDRKLVNRKLLALLVAGMFPVIAPAQAQTGRGELGAAAESGPLLLAQATSISALDAIAAAAAPPSDRGEYSGPLLLAQANSVSAPDAVAAAAPRPGRGESALISVAPPVPAPQNDPAPAPASALIVAPSAPPAAERPIAPAMGFKLWKIPPIRWSGNLAMDLRGASAQGQPRQVQLTESANLKADSFIWQPWIARVSGEMTLLATQQRQGQGSQSGSAASGSGIKFASLTGGAQFALFPVSRFPFTASFSQTDNRANGELAHYQYTSRRYDLTQSYAPLQGGSNYRLAYNHSDVNSAAVGADTAKALAASINWSSGFNTLSINGNGYTNTRSNSGDASSLNALYATHSYRPRPTFAIESLANYSSNQYHLASVGLPTDSRSRFLQFNSFATWRPEENSPLLVSGGARLFQNSASANGAAADTRTISANLAATYALNRNTRLSGAGTVTHTSVGAGGGGVFSNQTVGINHAADVIKFGEYAYNWTTDANLVNQSGGESGSRNFGVRIGHRVGRNFTLGEGSALFINVSQDYSILRDTLLSTSQSLLHNANASWSRRLGEAATTVLTLNAADSRTTGTAEQHFQFVNLQASGQMQFSRWASANANLTFQATRQSGSSAVSTATTRTTRTSADSFVTSAGGSLSYQNARAFGVPQLRYYALLDLNQFQGRSRLEGDINAPLERVAWAFEQRLDYDIGRLQTRLSLRVAEAGNRINSIIFFRVLRQFGGF